MRLPLTSESSRACDVACRERGPDSSNEFLQCISECPDAEIADSARCAEPDHRPDAFCARVVVATDAIREPGALMTILGLATEAAVGGAASAAADNAAETERRRARNAENGPGFKQGK